MRPFHIAIVGAGVIGSGWAAHFLAQGLDVVATDPVPKAHEDMVQRIDRVWPLLEQLGLSKQTLLPLMAA